MYIIKAWYKENEKQNDFERLKKCSKKMIGFFLIMMNNAALARYKEAVCYLTTLKEGAPRYNLAGEVCAYVTKEEEVEAERMLETL